ncbi:MAG TPA: 3-oxoacyl-ACP synthase, partial [Actinomycetota bacterium]|nr:3-oxoacyl-ACP synthase [Actinomycetota bacterium]
MEVALTAIATAIPDRSARVDDLQEIARLDDVERTTLQSLGIETIADDPSVGAADLAIAAGTATLAAAGIDAGELRSMVVAQPRVPDLFMASEGTRVQAGIGAAR